MPSCTVSKSQVRSISVENPTPPEKWVKYLAKYHYRIEIDHRDERAQSSKMATKESPASDSEWQLTDNELTVFDSIWQVVYWWCLLIVYLIFWKLWDWMLLLIVGPKASQWFLLPCFSVLIYRRTQTIYWFCLSISCRFVVLATLFLEIRRIISLWRKLMQLDKCNLFGRSSTKWLHLSFSFCVNADWMFDILNAYSSYMYSTSFTKRLQIG